MTDVIIVNPFLARIKHLEDLCILWDYLAPRSEWEVDACMDLLEQYATIPPAPPRSSENQR